MSEETSEELIEDDSSNELGSLLKDVKLLCGFVHAIKTTQAIKETGMIFFIPSYYNTKI